MFIFHLVCQLVLDVTAGDFASGLLDNLLSLKELTQVEVPVVMLHQLPGLLTLGDGGVSPLVPEQSVVINFRDLRPETDLRQI